MKLINHPSLSLLITIQLCLIGIGILNHSRVINPDAVAYLRIAQYYLDGNIDLAVSGYWGPLLSWFIAAFLALGAESIVAAKFATGISALIYLSGALRLFHVTLRHPTDVVIAGILTAVFGAHRAVAGISPDLLVSGLLLWGLSITISSDGSNRFRMVAAGLFYGLAYLAKSVALPISLMLILAVEAINFLDGQRIWTSFRRIGWTFVGLGAVATLWILTLSWHYRAPTFSTSAIIAHSLVGPEVQDHYFATTYHVPPAGRITAWEDPDPNLYRRWSSLSSLESFKHQIVLLGRNLKQIWVIFRSFDVIGLGLTACVLGFALGGKRRRNERWRLCGPAIAVSAAVYLPVYAAEVRYYIVSYPLLIAAAFGFVNSLCSSSAIGGTEQRSRFSRWVIASSAAAVTIFSFLPQTVLSLRYLFTRSESPGYSASVQLTQAMRDAPSGAIASAAKPDSVAFLAAFYGAYFSNRPFYGNRPDVYSLEDVKVAEPYFLVVQTGSLFEKNLLQNPRVRRILSTDSGLEQEQVSVFFIGDGQSG